MEGEKKEKYQGFDRKVGEKRMHLLNDEAWLRKNYVEFERSLESIAWETGFHRSTVLRRLRKLGIKTRDLKEALKLRDQK